VGAEEVKGGREEGVYGRDREEVERQRDEGGGIGLGGEGEGEEGVKGGGRIGAIR